MIRQLDAGWSSLAARRAHNPKVVGSNPAPATIHEAPFGVFYWMMELKIRKWAHAHFFVCFG